MSTTVPDGTHFGGVRAVRRVCDLTLSETFYRPDERVPAHAHDNPLFCVVLAGAFVEQACRRSRTLDAGAMLVHPPDEPHAHRFLQAAARMFTVQLGKPWMARIAPFGLMVTGGPRYLHAERANWLALQLYQEFALGSDASPLTVEGLVLAVLGDLMRHRPPRERTHAAWLATVRELLEVGFRDPPSLVELAQVVDVHPSTLSRAFRDRFGCTLPAYVRRRRVAVAGAALAGSDVPLVRVAADTGFSDQGHFSREFKRETGMTPGAFRALHLRRSA